jgi:hypothetical protein
MPLFRRLAIEMTGRILQMVGSAGFELAVAIDVAAIWLVANC